MGLVRRRFAAVGLFVALSAWPASPVLAGTEPTTTTAAPVAAGEGVEVPAESYVHSMCDAAIALRGQLEATGQSAAVGLDTAPDLFNARALIVAFVTQTIAIVDTFIDRVRDAGVPQVKNGAKIVKLSLRKYSVARGVFTKIQASAAQLDIGDDATFSAGLNQITRAVTVQQGQFRHLLRAASKKYNTKPLDKLRKKDDLCKDVQFR